LKKCKHEIKSHPIYSQRHNLPNLELDQCFLCGLWRIIRWYSGILPGEDYRDISYSYNIRDLIWGKYAS